MGIPTEADIPDLGVPIQVYFAEVPDTEILHIVATLDGQDNEQAIKKLAKG